MSLENTIKITEKHIIDIKTKRVRKAKKETPTCAICAEDYNKSYRTLVRCEYCPFEACRECCEHFLLDENKPTCMDRSCNRQWTPEFISNNFTKKYINNDFKTHCEKILFDKQRALLPSTQQLVEDILKREDYLRKIAAASDIVMKARIETNKIQNEYFRFINAPNRSRERTTFTRACPSPDCRGFLSSQWKCGLCNIWTCPTCHEIKGDNRDCEHTCQPDNVATANLLNSDTKQCPKCGEGIFKIDGCSQIWCTQCHTAFCWRTGRIETVIHNPHYYEWMRRNGTLERNPNDIQCGREINHNTSRVIRSFMNDYENKYSENAIKIKQLQNYMIEVVRRIIHFRVTSLQRYQYNSEEVTRNMRIQYMRNFISEENFKIALQKDDKKNNKYREIREVIQLLINTLIDIVYRFIEEIKNPDWKYNLDRMNEVDQIIQYSDECFHQIGKTYNSIPLTYQHL